MFSAACEKQAVLRLYNLFHPAILDGRAWSKVENIENTEHMEKMENINQIPKTLYERFKNTLLMIKNTPYVTNALSVKQMTQNTFTAFMATVAEIITYRRLENLILGQFKMREDPAKCAFP